MKKEKIKLSVILGELLILISFILVIVFATIGQKLEFIIPLIVVFPLIGMLINGFFGKFIPNRWVHQVAIGAILASFTTAVVSVLKLASFSEERVIVHLFSWISVGHFNVDFSFMLDHLSSVMILVITGIGGLIHLYSVGYMHGDKSYSRFFTYLNLFVFAMLILVLGSNMLMMFIGWEGVGLASYLLIGFWFNEAANATAGKKAFLTNRVGDFGFLIGMFVILGVVGSLDYTALEIATLPGGVITAGIATTVALLLFVGAMGKSAQIPLYIWLPDAMAGPTPVSALIHAATMVTAGVYMITRLNYLFILSPVAMSFIAIIGASTALFAASIALVQKDIKKVLAYSTVSQLGYMFLAVGVGAFGAGVMHLMTHAFFKATLFLGAGSVIHGMSGDQNMEDMGGLSKKMKHTWITMMMATIAITGILPLSGFISKDEILWKAFSSGNKVLPWLPNILWAMGVLAAIMTSFYMWRLFFLTFHSGETRHPENKVKNHIHESPWTMTSVLWILGSFSVVIGWIGLPHLFYHGHGIFNIFHRWLEPVVSVSESKIHAIHHGTGIEITMMLISTSLALTAFGIAWFFYKKEISSVPASIARKMRPVYRVLLNKYYVDEFYYFLIRTIILWGSDKILFRTIDEIIIDKILVQGLGRIFSWMGNIIRLFQNGNTQYYVLVMITAFFAFFMFMTL